MIRLSKELVDGISFIDQLTLDWIRNQAIAFMNETDQALLGFPVVPSPEDEDSGKGQLIVGHFEDLGRKVDPHERGR